MNSEGLCLETEEVYADPDSDTGADTDTDVDTGVGDIDSDGYSVEQGDCDDGDPTVHPGAQELCDGLDQDCDGQIDEEALPVSWYRDQDEDGYGDEATTIDACPAPQGYVANAADCDDATAAVNPDAQEVCSGRDEDCDGLVDGDDPSMNGLATWYADADADGYGSETSFVESCDQPSGYGSTAGDCNDTDSRVHPGATEVCDEIDQDCDGVLDEDASDAPHWYADVDADGYGDVGNSTSSCDAPAGYVADSEDCNDADAAVSPAETEICGDGIDNDCDGGAGSCGISGRSSLGSSDLKLTGDLGEQAGFSIAWAGDTDGDGADDVLTGGPTHSINTGVVTLVTGAPVGTGTLTSYVRLTGEAASDYAGYSVAGAGDTNGDGFDDVLVGAIYNDSAAGASGRAYLLYGPVTSSASLGSADITLNGEGNTSLAGGSVAGLGDVDGDGVDDFAVGAWGDNGTSSMYGAAYVLSGATVASGSLSAATAELGGESSGDYAGYSISTAGDIDGDGFNDILIGAPYSDAVGSDAGAAYLVLGPTSGVQSLASADAELQGLATTDYTGTSVAGGGDVDGDGNPDLLIGAFNADAGGSNSGAAYLMTGMPSGTLSLSTATATFVGENAGDEAGVSVSIPGDLDGDGLAEVSIGAWSEDSGATDAGVAYVINGGGLSGTIDLSAWDAKLAGELANDRAGSAIGGAGDLDGDGQGDLLVGARAQSTAGASAGAAYVLFGGGL